MNFRNKEKMLGRIMFVIGLSLIVYAAVTTVYNG
jgi:hypothetical protein